MIAHPIAAAVFCLAAGVLTLQAQAGTVKPTGKSAAVKPAAKAPAKAAAKPATKAAAKPSAKPAPVPVAEASPLNEAQMAMASQVLTGRVDCEFSQTVMVEPHASHEGHFRVKYNSTTYNMVPEETSTGAVRLVDNKAGVVWLQIPVKSMMMNSKAGRRMVDACSHPTQRMAEAEARAAQAALAASTTGAPAVTQSVDNQATAPGTASANAGNPPLLR